MKPLVLLYCAMCLLTIGGCSSDNGNDLLETARLEEKQNNIEHAIQLYEEITSKYPGSPLSLKAKERLTVLRGDK